MNGSAAAVEDARKILKDPTIYQDVPSADGDAVRDCDAVMKGGITSGVVYPLAVCELARKLAIASLGRHGTRLAGLRRAISVLFAASRAAAFSRWLSPWAGSWGRRPRWRCWPPGGYRRTCSGW